MNLSQKDIARHQELCDTIRESLAKGPWSLEPDRVEFKNQGFDCLLVRSENSFSWCGYVAVPVGHPAFGKDSNDKALDDIRIHGGLTYTKSCHGVICHRTEKEDDNVWWLGFDCARCYDLSPRYQGMSFTNFGGVYRDVEYVRTEVLSLATQLKLLEIKNERTGTFKKSGSIPINAVALPRTGSVDKGITV